MEDEEILFLTDLFADAAKDYVNPRFKELRDELQVLRELITVQSGLLAGYKSALDGTVIALVRSEIEKLPKPKDGMPGKDGRDGQDASLPDIKAAVMAEVEKAVAAIPAAKDGQSGRDGKDGKDGESIHPDSIRLMVVEEVKKQVADIPRPRDGHDGKDGRDALDIEIVPMMEAKSYPRGTFVAHNGGVLRARLNTSPEFKPEEWQVCMNGHLPAEAELSEDFRTVSISFPQTNGMGKLYKFHTPALLYQQIWDSSKSYVQGDVVTYEGAMWGCQVESTRAKPAEKENHDWRLMVRKGNDGKPGPAGTKGDPGKDGKDLTRIGQGVAY